MSVFHPSHLEPYLKAGFCREKHPTEDLYIYGYSTHTGGRQWDDLSVNLRGLIIDSEGTVKARSFRKFFTFKYYLSKDTALLSDNQILKIPDEKFQLFEKIDGTLCILYWIGDKPHLATQRSFTSAKAVKATRILHDKYAHTFGNLKKDRTYLFEAIISETTVVVNYKEKDALFLIGIIDNATGDSLPLENIGYPTPRDYSSDFDLIKDLKALQSLNIPNIEGIVVLFESGLRIKVKFPWYKESHTLIDQLIHVNRLQYQLIRKLKNQFSFDPNFLSNHKIWLSMKTGSLAELMKHVPLIHYHFGLELWVEKCVLQYRDFYSGDQREDILQAYAEEVFDINSMNIEYSDSVMWNFQARINNLFS